MSWPKFVHMVALIGTAAGVQEGKQTGNQQSGFVVCYSVGTGKNRARLAVKAAAIGKKDRVFCRILFC